MKQTDILLKNLDELSIRRRAIAKQTAACLSMLSQAQKDMGRDKTHLSIDNMLTDEAYEIFPAKRRAVISYVKNNYNDAAFLRFSSLFTATKVTYGSGFEEICENVYNGLCDFCILPLESAPGGKLFSFYSLIEKYELHIIAACDIDEASTSKRTRYALVSKRFILPDKDKSRYFFEFSLIKDENSSLPEILDAAEALGTVLYRIDSIPVPYDDLTFRIYHVFEGEASSLTSLASYLFFKHPQSKTVGRYLLIE